MTNLSGANLNNGAAVGPQGEGRESPSTFPAYPHYRDSGVEWLGAVPTYWESWKISHAFGELGSGTTPPTSEAQWYEDGTVPWVTTGELRESVIWETKKLLSSTALSAFSALQLHPAGSLAIAMYGATIGRLGILGVDATTNQACCLLTRPNHLHVKFTFYWLLVFKQSIIDLYASGGGQPNINQEIIANLKVPAPGIPEQTQIARFLDHETARIDALIEEQQRLIELLKEKRQAVISHTVTKGLDPTVPMKDSGVEWLGEVPAHWELTRVGWQCIVGNGCTPARDNLDYWEDGHYPWLNSSKVNLARVIDADQFVTNKALKECALPIVKPGCVLMAITGEGKTRGMVTITEIEATINQHVAFIEPRGGRLLAAYLHDWLSANYSRIRHDSADWGSTKAAITCADIRAYPLPLPPEEEQEAICQFVGSRSALFDGLMSSAEENVGLLQERRSALISAAVTGKIDVRGWQPPASAPTLELVQEAV